MRRKDREITDLEEIRKIISHCDTIRIAMHDGDYPYMVALNFGEAWHENQLSFYCHSAMEGKKIDLLKKNNKVFFEMDCEHQVILYDQRMSCTMGYASVMGEAEVTFIEENEDKVKALRILMKHFHEETFPFKEEVAKKTCVFRLDVKSYTAKRRNNVHKEETSFKTVTL